MKHPTGYVKSRRVAAPRKAVRLDLKRRPVPEPEFDLKEQKEGIFWKWVLLVALLHLLAFSLFYLIYETAPTPKPTPPIFSLLPVGDVVKGTAGFQEAKKVGPSTPAPAVHRTSASSSPTVSKPAKPVQPKPIPPKAELKIEKPTLTTDKPILPPKPAPQKTPKVKVDLTLADAPTTAADQPKVKPHHKKTIEKPTPESEDQNQESLAKPDSAGLSKEEIAARLGDKLDAAGTKNAPHPGISGSTNSHSSPFQDFYNSIAQQIDDEWQIPNVAAGMSTYPVVSMHVEKNGRVPAESVYLARSSGNADYDDSAVAAVKNLGYLHEPLPEGCPPDISINVKPAP